MCLISGVHFNVPALKGRLEFKNQKQKLLTTSEIAKVDKEINIWKHDLNYYIKTPCVGHDRMKIVGQLKNGELDVSTLSFFIEGPIDNKFFPYSMDNIPTPAEVQEKAYKAIQLSTENAKKQSINSLLSNPYSITSNYIRFNARDYALQYSSDATKNCALFSTVKQDPSKYNPSYTWYQCADCANFVSQALHAGGIPTSTTWHGNDSSCYAWIRVNDLFSYLMNHGYIAGCVQDACVAGYPFRLTNVEHAMLMVYNDGFTRRFCAHTNDRLNSTWDESSMGPADYYEVIY